MCRPNKTYHRWSPEEIQEVLSYYKNTDYTTKEIADLFDTTSSNLRQALNRNGFKLYDLRGIPKKAEKPKKSNPKKEERAELELKVLTALKSSTSRVPEIAKMFDLTPYQVNYILSKYKINLTCLRNDFYDKE